MGHIGVNNTLDIEAGIAVVSDEDTLKAIFDEAQALCELAVRPATGQHGCSIRVGCVNTFAEDALTHSRGIGLWVVRFIVTVSGGSLTVPSTSDEGTVVSIRLPLVEE